MTWISLATACLQDFAHTVHFQHCPEKPLWLPVCCPKGKAKRGGHVTADEEEAPEEAASRWREGVLEDAGTSSSFAGAFNLDTRSRQISALPIATVRQRWSPAAAQVLNSSLYLTVPANMLSIM